MELSQDVLCPFAGLQGLGSKMIAIDTSQYMLKIF
jgi:hypothetical protein